MLYAKFISCTVTFPNFDVDWAKSFQRCRSAHLMLLHLFEILLCVRRRVLLSDDHKTNYRSLQIPKHDMRVSLSTTVPRISDILRRKQGQKSH